MELKLFVLLYCFIRTVHSCTEDCSIMSSTCKVSHKCNVIITKTPPSPQPILPVVITPILHPNGQVGTNITWLHTPARSAPSEYAIIARSVRNTHEEICINYKMQREISETSKFYYDCLQPTSHHIEVFGSPTGYAHRIIFVFNQTHNAENTATWAPYLLEVYNNSCSSEITMTFNRPPIAYGFSRLDVNLAMLVNGGTERKTRRTLEQINTSREPVSFHFTGVPDGWYKLYIYAQLNDVLHMPQCRCRRNGRCRPCISSYTHQFLVNKSHSSCPQEPATALMTQPLPSNGTPTWTVVSVGIITVAFIAIVLILTIVIRKWWCSRKRHLQTRGSDNKAQNTLLLRNQNHGDLPCQNSIEPETPPDGLSSQSPRYFTGLSQDGASIAGATICEMFGKHNKNFSPPGGWELTETKSTSDEPSYAPPIIINNAKDASVQLNSDFQEEHLAAQNGYIAKPPLSHNKPDQLDKTSNNLTCASYMTYDKSVTKDNTSERLITPPIHIQSSNPTGPSVEGSPSISSALPVASTNTEKPESKAEPLANSPKLTASTQNGDISQRNLGVLGYPSSRIPMQNYKESQAELQPTLNTPTVNDGSLSQNSSQNGSYVPPQHVAQPATGVRSRSSQQTPNTTSLKSNLGAPRDRSNTTQHQSDTLDLRANDGAVSQQSSENGSFVPPQYFATPASGGRSHIAQQNSNDTPSISTVSTSPSENTRVSQDHTESKLADESNAKDAGLSRTVQGANVASPVSDDDSESCYSYVPAEYVASPATGLRPPDRSYST